MRLIDADALMKASQYEFWQDASAITPIGEYILKKFRQLIRNTPTVTPEPKWIPCSERLPEDDTEVFIYLFDRPSPYIAWIEDTHWYTEDFEVDREDEPIAWMPLPEPYKEES